MYHTVCTGEGVLLGVTRRMDIFSNSKPEAEGLALIIKSLFPDVMAVSVGYEYLPFEINREFSVIMDCNSNSTTIEFSEFDSSDLERIKRYRSSYINVELVWKPWRGVLWELRKGLLGRVLQRIARGIAVYCMEEIVQGISGDDASVSVRDDLLHVRIPLRRRMRVRHIECEKRRLFGGNLLPTTPPCVLECRDRDLDVLMNCLPVEEHRFVNDVLGGYIKDLLVERLVAKARFYRLGNSIRIRLNGAGDAMRWWRCIT
jgi:hypothetical protein